MGAYMCNTSLGAWGGGGGGGGGDKLEEVGACDRCNYDARKLALGTLAVASQSQNRTLHSHRAIIIKRCTGASLRSQCHVTSTKYFRPHFAGSASFNMWCTRMPQ